VKVPDAHSANLLSLSAAADEGSHQTANARARMFSQSPILQAGGHRFDPATLHLEKPVAGLFSSW
jgi:hypothetical protein